MADLECLTSAGGILGLCSGRISIGICLPWRLRLLHAPELAEAAGFARSDAQSPGSPGGVSPRPWISLLAEHDAERVNAGVRLRVWRLNLLGAAYGMDGLSGGISYTHQLKK
jgi:hypothetical protein